MKALLAYLLLVVVVICFASAKNRVAKILARQGRLAYFFTVLAMTYVLIGVYALLSGGSGDTYAPLIILFLAVFVGTPYAIIAAVRHRPTPR